MKHFNEINKNFKKGNLLHESIDDQHKTDESINHQYKENQNDINQLNIKKYNISSNNFHKKNYFNNYFMEQNKYDKKNISPQTLIFKDVNKNPFLKSAKNFIDKNIFMDKVKKNGNIIIPKESNIISFEKKKMSKTNYNFAEFLKSNTEKKSLNFASKKNIMSKEKLIISADTNYISNNLLNNGTGKN